MQRVEARDGRKLAVESLGDQDGEPTFLLHGTPGGLTGPRPRGIVLYRQGIRLISYNRPGYADSDQLPGRRVTDAAEDVEDIADYFGIKRFGVIGRSGGAPHALACAARLPGRVICAAALGSLAPYNAAGLEWMDGMVASNVKAYRDAEQAHRNTAEDHLGALITTLNDHRRKLHVHSEGLLRTLGPELEKSDENVIGNIALRRMIARTHAQAVRDGIDGWVDDVLALGSPEGWGFDLSDITMPVLLWHGADDKFSPVSHAEWLAKQIHRVEIDIQPSLAHFDAVSILPQILSWVQRKVTEELVS
jgi:pimeloyl-ACP methyl ester carboxylesterase